MDMKKLLNLAKILVKLAEYELPSGKLVAVGELSVGAEVWTEDGEKYPDGEYLIDGKKVKVADGKVEEIEVAEPEDKPAEVESEMAKKCGLEEEDKPAEPAAEEPKAEDKPAEEMEDDKDLKIKELEGLLADRDAVIAELTEKVKALEEKIAKPVEESIAMNKVESTSTEKKGIFKYFKD